MVSSKVHSNAHKQTVIRENPSRKRIKGQNDINDTKSKTIVAKCFDSINCVAMVSGRQLSSQQMANESFVSV